MVASTVLPASSSIENIPALNFSTTLPNTSIASSLGKFVFLWLIGFRLPGGSEAGSGEVVRPNDTKRPKSTATEAIVAQRRDLSQPPRDVERKGHNRPDQSEGATNGDPYKAERQQDQPQDGIEHQRHKREWPAQHKKNAPEQKGDHDILNYASGTREVPPERQATRSPAPHL